MSELLENYKQYSDHHPADSTIPSDGKQRIDLDEFYEETNQKEATMVVAGIEAMSLGKISKKLAMALRIKGAESFDPFESERNAVAGQEGFFTVIKDGFKAFIEGIIKYIKMAVNWVVDTFKAIFGFRKSSRITKAIDDSLEDMRKEFNVAITGLGLDPNVYNVDNFIGNMPSGVDRLGQLTLMKTKIGNEEDSIKALAEAVPLLQKCVMNLANSSNRAEKAQQNLKRVIGDEYKRLSVRAGKQYPPQNADDSPERNRVIKACLEVNQVLEVSSLTKDVQDLFETLYQIKFSSSELEDGFNNVRKRIQDTLVTESVKIKEINKTGILTSIQYLNQRYIDIGKDEINLRGIKPETFGKIINAEDAVKIEAMDNWLKQGHGVNSGLLQDYNRTAKSVRDFTQYTFIISNTLLIVERQIENLCSWYHRANLYFTAGVVSDIETMRKVNLDARKAGLHPKADLAGTPLTPFVFIKDGDAETLVEKVGAVNEVLYKQNFGGVKDSIETFSKQIGWKP